MAGYPGRSAVFDDPTPVDPGCFAAFPKVLAARKTGHRFTGNTVLGIVTEGARI
jgi:hypothetical protein